MNLLNLVLFKAMNLVTVFDSGVDAIMQKVEPYFRLGMGVLAACIGLAAIVCCVIAGAKIMGSGGDVAKKAQAWDSVKNVLVGCAVSGAGGAIITVIWEVIRNVS